MFIYPLLIELRCFQRFHSGSAVFVSVLLKRAYCEPGEPAAAVFGWCRGEGPGADEDPSRESCLCGDALQIPQACCFPNRRCTRKRSGYSRVTREALKEERHTRLYAAGVARLRSQDDPFKLGTPKIPCVLSRFSRVRLGDHGLHPPRLLCPWDSPGKNTGVDCHALLQGISLTQGLNLHL